MLLKKINPLIMTTSIFSPVTAELWPQHGVSPDLWLCCVQNVSALQTVLLPPPTIPTPHRLCNRCCCQGAWPGQRERGKRQPLVYLCHDLIHQPCFSQRKGLPPFLLCYSLGSKNSCGISNRHSGQWQDFKVSKQSRALRQSSKKDEELLPQIFT